MKENIRQLENPLLAMTYLHPRDNKTETALRATWLLKFYQQGASVSTLGV